MMGCPVIEWQLLAKDPDAAAEFYGGLFGWSIDPNNALGYRRVPAGPGGIGGGIWPSPPEGHNLVQLFVGVDSVPDYHARAERMGAKTIVPPQKLPDGDELAIMLDPSGVPFGLMKKASSLDLHQRPKTRDQRPKTYPRPTTEGRRLTPSAARP